MALNVHTNQQYVKYSETNTWRNRTWERIPRITRNAPGRTLAAITPFPFLCAFPQDNPLKIPLLEASSHTYIYQSQNKKPKYVPKKEGKSSFPFFFSFFLQSFFFFYVFVSTSQNSICWRKSTFLYFISLPLRKSECFSLSM